MKSEWLPEGFYLPYNPFLHGQILEKAETLTELRVYMIITQKCHYKGYVKITHYFKAEDIANQLNVTKVSVQRSFKSLSNKGFILTKNCSCKGNLITLISEKDFKLGIIEDTEIKQLGIIEDTLISCEESNSKHLDGRVNKDNINKDNINKEDIIIFKVYDKDGNFKEVKKQMQDMSDEELIYYLAGKKQYNIHHSIIKTGLNNFKSIKKVLEMVSSIPVVMEVKKCDQKYAVGIVCNCLKDKTELPKDIISFLQSKKQETETEKFAPIYKIMNIGSPYNNNSMLRAAQYILEVYNTRTLTRCNTKGIERLNRIAKTCDLKVIEGLLMDVYFGKDFNIPKRERIEELEVKNIMEWLGGMK